MFEESLETNNILKNMGNFPIHIRQTQKWRMNKHNCQEKFQELGEVNPSFDDGRNISDPDTDRKPIINTIETVRFSDLFSSLSCRLYLCSGCCHCPCALCPHPGRHVWLPPCWQYQTYQGTTLGRQSNQNWYRLYRMLGLFYAE